MSDDLTRTAHFLFEAGTLKRQRRSGWWMAGVRDPESVAEHSWRTAVIASIIATMEGANPAQAALLATWHDTGETRSGDVNHLGKRYLPGEADPVAIAEDQADGMPEGVAPMVRGLAREYAAQETAEARCAKDADKLECMLQGIEYQQQGYTAAQRWIDNSRTRIKTKSGQDLADAVLQQGPLDWLHAATQQPPRSA